MHGYQTDILIGILKIPIPKKNIRFIFILIKVYFCEMKKSRKIIALFHVIILYYFTLFFYSTSLETFNPSSDGLSSWNESCYLLFSGNLYSSDTQLQNIIKELKEHPTPFPKNHFKDSIDHSNTEGSSFLIRFSKFILYKKNIVRRFQTADIIFPFHYFW